MPRRGGAVMFNRMVDRSAPPRQSCAMSDRADPLDLVFSALADPTRRAILALLLEDDMAVTDVAEPFAMSLPAISKHLGVLSAAGLISQERRGRVKWCKLEPEALREASVWMQAFGQFDRLDLDAFERFLETELRDTPEEDEPGADDLPAETAGR
jgi:DNA-binding transcriptional ArsR family regulator